MTSDLVRGCHPVIRYADSTVGTGNIFAAIEVSVAPGGHCVLRGVPSVTLTDANGHRLASHETQHVSLLGGRSKTVHVRPGHPTGFQIAYRYVSAETNRPCRVVAGINVRFPGARQVAHLMIPPSGSKVEASLGDETVRVFAPCNGDFAVSALG